MGTRYTKDCAGATTRLLVCITSRYIWQLSTAAQAEIFYRLVRYITLSSWTDPSAGSMATTGAQPKHSSIPHSLNFAPTSPYHPSPTIRHHTHCAYTWSTSAPSTPMPFRCSSATRGLRHSSKYNALSIHSQIPTRCRVLAKAHSKPSM